jgi:hypothetical protein
MAALTTNLYAQGLKPKQAAKFKTNIAKDSISLKKGGKVYVYQDNSEKIRFMGQLCLATAELASGDIFKWGFGVSGDVYLKKYLSLHAEYTKDYIDVMKMLSRNDNQTNYNLNDVSGFQSVEAGVRVFLKDEHTKKHHRIILESHSHGRTTINYYIKPTLPCRNILALRAGFIGNTSVVTTDMNSNGTVRAQDGTILAGNYFTNAYTRGGYIGIANLVLFSTVTKNSLKKGNVFLSKAVNELYADVLFATTTFDAVVDTSGIHQIVTNANGSFQSFPVGARVGYKRSKENRGIGSSKIELGYRPGLKGNGFYFNVGFSLALIK